MIKIERTITIHRPVEEVFAYLCDVQHGPSYISGQREAHTTSSGPMGIGTTFATSGKFPGRGASYEIVEYELNSRLAWRAASGARATTTWGFQPSGPSTRVTFTRVADPQGLSRLAESLLQGLTNGKIDQDLGALKELLAVTRKPAVKGW
ncbi:MAG TPA: SRPBCC family protein [Chloroflexota bacterium]|jgi:uncharacterized protein YndB with AHSA1/START domain